MFGSKQGAFVFCFFDPLISLYFVSGGNAMRKKVIFISILLCGAGLLLLAIAAPAAAKTVPLTPMEKLGKMLFLDKDLSLNDNQSCATCHAAEFGYTGPKGNINAAGAVYPGSDVTLFGNRKPPTAAYGGESPVLYYDEGDEVWVGGMFWDGRATGEILGQPLAEQAKGPFLNPVEMALDDEQGLCMEVQQAHYAKLFEQVWGEGSLVCEESADYYLVYDQIGLSIAAYEMSNEVNPFSSKFDSFWDKAKAKGLPVTDIGLDNWEDYLHLGLKSEEVYGLAVFNDEDAGKCALCHTLDEGTAGYPLFTDFTYDNLGVPMNPLNPVYGNDPDFVDLGLGAFLEGAGYPEEVYLPEYGKVKVPTLRNVDLREGHTVKAYTHNGYFKSLKDIVHFYNTRDVENWPEPEYAATVNDAELGNLGLSPAQEDALVAFMKTLSDKVVP
jgi:cytochrome c peroxidase